MDQEKRRKFELVFCSIEVIVSIFALYMFIFVMDMAIVLKIFWCIIGIGWLFSAVTGILENFRKK